jgi:hypothetical protein
MGDVITDCFSKKSFFTLQIFFDVQIFWIKLTYLVILQFWYFVERKCSSSIFVSYKIKAFIWTACHITFTYDAMNIKSVYDK